MFDIIVIGAGPAGLTAAIYGCRAGKSVLLMEKSGFGGQMTFSPKIENYPGFTSVSGSELADKMVEQVMAQGAEVEFAEASKIMKTDNGFLVETDCGSFYGSSVIIAVGAKHRRLGVPGEDALIGNGVSFCAVCDGAFYAGQHVCVIGGGNSALQEAVQLAENCSAVTVLQDLDRLTGEGRLIDAVLSNPKIKVIYGARVTEFVGKGELSGVKYTLNGETVLLPVKGTFVAVGLIPEAGRFSDVIGTDERGCAISDERCITDTEGIFVAGDCRTKSVRQVSTAIADGACAALAACSFLDQK